jgi:hypothetical protein
MPGSVTTIFLDVDDEITSAAARVRGAVETRVVLVVPPGSRIATSRMNFRLLARDAAVNGRRLAVVTPDTASRSLAAAAGLESFATVGEAEAALGATPGPGPEAGIGGVAAAAGGAAAVVAGPGSAVGSLTTGPGTAGARPAPASPTSPPPTSEDLRPRSASAAGAAAPTPGPTTRRSGRAGRGILLSLLVLLLAAVGVGAVIAWLYLPSASVVLTPRVEPLGPIEVTVTADPEATEVDAAAGVVPAVVVSIDVEASGTFEATGQRVEETKATGTVRWTNCDPTEAYTIAAGAVVRTASGVTFATTDGVFLPVAILEGTQLACQSRDVGVVAVQAGPSGNVAAGTITVVPPSLNRVVVRVTNREATTGGTRETFPRVTQADVDAAMKALDEQLAAAFAAELEDPDAVAADLTVFPETGVLGEPTYDPDPAGLVGQEVTTFTLSASATGTATAVDEASLGQVAEDRLRTSVEPGYALVADSIETSVGTPTVVGQTIVFPTSASGLQVRIVDAAELEAQILGKTEDETRAILEPYGAVDITLWPDWVTTIPTFDARVDFVVEETVVPEASPGASLSPGEPSARPSESPSS